MNDLRKYLTPLNLMLVGALALLAMDLGLATNLAIAWHEASSDHSSEYAQDMLTYTQLQAQMSHLRGMPTRIDSSRSEADKFFGVRIPANESTLLTELGELAAHDHVRLSRAGYTLAPAVESLVEQRIDASLTGEYVPIMHFINDVERDKSHAFFIIRSVTLTGQQAGAVNLRMRLTTYMRADAASAAVLTTSGQPGTEVQ